MIKNEYKKLFYDSNSDHQIYVFCENKKIADNSSIEFESFELEESICSDEELKFGSCESNCIKLVLRGAPSLSGKRIEVFEEITNSGLDPFRYGEYTVVSDVPSSDKAKREITAYDAIYDIINSDVKDWYEGLNFPLTLKQFRDSFFEYFGIEQTNTVLVNDDMTVNKTLAPKQTVDSDSQTEDNSISGKTILTAICEINGAFGNINRYGKFEYVILPNITNAVYPSDNLFPSNTLFPSDANTESMSGHYIEFDYEDFNSKSITLLEIRPTDSSAGIIVGTPGNNYVVSGNFLVSDKKGSELKQIASNLFQVIKHAEYTPLKFCECIGNPCLEIGDPIRFNTSREIVNTYILQRTLSGIQNKKDFIVSSGTEIHSKKVNSIKETVSNVLQRTSTLERNSDHLQTEFYDFGKNVNSKFEQTASSFDMSVYGEEEKIGIVIKLLNSSGNVISSSSEEANIVITGVVRFDDLSKEGATTINGANITTGSISCDRLSGGTINGQTFVQLGEYGETIIQNGVIRVPSVGAILVGSDQVATQSWMQLYGHAKTAGVANTAEYAYSSGTASGLSGSPTISVNRCYADDFYFVGSPSAGSSLLPIGYNASTYHFGHYTGSSERFKNSISNVTDGELDAHRLYNVEIFQYKYNTEYLSNKKDCRYDKLVIGFIAENLEKEYPIAVDKNEEGTIMDWNYKYIIPPMLKLIQEQKQEIEKLKQEIFANSGEIDILNQRLKILEEKIC